MANGRLLPKTASDDFPFMREIYRALMGKGKAYASFDLEMLNQLVDSIAGSNVIFDPMSGYGTLSRVCNEKGIGTYLIEINPPAYLWQILTAPQNAHKIKISATILYSLRKKFPKESVSYEVSSDWFPTESKRLLRKLWIIYTNELKNHLHADDVYTFAAAIMLPFLGRLTAYCPGTVNIQVKPGGVVQYSGWRDCLSKYSQAFLNIDTESVSPTNNTILYGDAKTINLNETTFSSMITSPPYPNSRDYYTMFHPENVALAELFEFTQFAPLGDRSTFVGTAIVSEFKKDLHNRIYSITSASANEFIEQLSKLKAGKRAEYDIMSYYVPYFLNYFISLETAYRNISQYIAKDFHGYVVVVNNTSRKYIVPVEQAVREIWTNLGFNATVEHKYSSEKSHVGAINPRASGFKARHMEYVIRLSR